VFAITRSARPPGVLGANARANRHIAAAAILVFVSTLALRVWGISTHFWLLRDQIRDWSIALGSFTELPLVGPATHVGGYTIGPAFYWILWAIRVTVGPWFQNLPHAGGIGQAILQSGADALLLVAVWRRTRSPWAALTAVVLVATASYDLCLAPLVWNPTMGSMLAKVATALVLLGWHRGSTARVALTATVAWSAVHAYTGAIFVTVGVFAAFLANPAARRDWQMARRNTSIIAIVVAILQLPYVAHQVLNRFGDRAMSAVSGSVGQILSGSARPELSKSLTGYVDAFNFIEVAPWQIPMVGWALFACGATLAVAYRRDLSLLAVTLLPQIAAIVGYSLFLDDLDHYYYLSLMPAAVLTVVLAAATAPPPRLARFVGVALLIGALTLVPARVRFAATMHRMPQYGLLVDGARKIRSVRQPMRAVRTDMFLPPTSNPEILYRALGGRIDPTSPWIAIITSDGRVVYQHVIGS
jgi:hypothetical protein